jgi:drug/metabolite transporter (DMT)-like permease
MLGTAIGILGVALVCLGPSSFGSGSAFRAGFVFAIVATVVSSLSNLLSQRNQRHGLPVMQTNAFGMLYGATFVSLYCLAAGRHFALDLSARYLGSLLFLSLFGSVIAFWAYLTLIGRIGAGRAGYAMVAIPIVALALSTAFEGLRWEWTLALGAALCLAGNFLVLPKAPKPAETAA